jgi:hypothetical protein
MPELSSNVNKRDHNIDDLIKEKYGGVELD